MSPDGDGGTPVTPDEAFALLGDETRLSILRALGAADGALRFSELRERVGAADSGRFNYHLGELAGQFVEKTEDGYALARAGRRVVEAVLAGAVTDAPGFDRTGVDQSCRYCGAPVEADWTDGSVRLFCTDCDGTYGEEHSSDGGRTAPDGYLGRLPLPPAGLEGRTPDEAVRAAWTWANLEIMALSSGLCPRCAATVETAVYVCDDHDPGDGVCAACDRRHEVGVGFQCTNCILHTGGALSVGLVARTPLLDALTDAGHNPVAPDSIDAVDGVHDDYGEEVLSTDPFRARLTFDVDGDRLALTVDDDLAVVETTRPD
jgi:DNA-binding HxlR family transcriptional regulator